MAKEYQLSDLRETFSNVTGKFLRHHHEINLVPDIKSEMIKTLKLRNLIFFFCIVIAAASVGVVMLFGAIAGGQQLVINSKKTTIESLSDKLNSFSDLNDYLTIKDQLSNISNITDNKKVLSRTFNILSALLPTGADSIKISELNINLTGETPSFTFDAQADAGRPPYIDYNVLDSFKKSMKYMRYDYGHYVDKDDNIIPAYCMIEANSEGAFFTDPETKDLYAYWNINGEGCNPAASSEQDEESDDTDTKTNDYITEDYNGIAVVKVWRTPQFKAWYKENPSSSEPSIDLNGTISNIPHFESACITYSGEIIAGSDEPKWDSSNTSCLLVPGGDSGISISESSNGRNASNELVLRFSASIALASEVYDFNNTHMLALAPSGRYNVTDSYVQVQAMFGQRARDCATDDTACKGGN